MKFKENLENWRKSIANSRYRVILIVSIVFCLLVSIGLARSYDAYEKRPGIEIQDPILSHFHALDISIPIFILTYGILLLGSMIALRHPNKTVLTLQSFAMMASFRLVTLFLTPFVPPAGIIPLQDPINSIFFYSGRANLNDLFFSGHTAVPFLFFFIFKNSKIRYIFLVLGILIGCGVLVQKIHYSIDVFAAPFFSYAAVGMARMFSSSFGLDREQSLSN